MRTYIIRRLLLIVPTMFLVSILLFLLIRLIPGNIVDQMIRERPFSMDAARAAIEQELGLDVPIFEQYGRWLGVLPGVDGSFNGIFQGSLGNSLWTNEAVVKLIINRLPVTIELVILAILIMIIISIPIGIYSAMRQNTMGDLAGRSFATVLIALPNFWVGLMIILVASIWWGVSPPLRPISFIEDPIGNLGQFIVPALLLGMAGTGTTMRMARSMMLEVLRQDYIRTAWAKGLKERVIIMRHALKNALIPVVTLVGINLAYLVGGTVIIETVFSLPGIGRLLVESTSLRDYTIVSGVAFFYAAVLIMVNIIVDLTYGYLDPRIRFK